MKSLRIIFAGTPDFAATHLTALLEHNHDIVAVYTQPDKPAGRGKKIQMSPVKTLAQQHHIPVYQPKSLRNEDVQQKIKALDADLMIVVAYGLILPQAVLDIPRHGCFNVHGSLLPQWRGAAPIQRSIWAGDQETGVTIMQMDAGLDTGDMLLKTTCPIEKNDTSASLYEKLAHLGSKALLETVELVQQNKLTPIQQDDEQATYAKKLTKEEAILDWKKPAVTLEREIRAFNPWPVSVLQMQDKNIKVRQASVIPYQGTETIGTIVNISEQGIDVVTQKDILRIETMQLPNKKSQPVSQILNGHKDLFQLGQKLDISCN